MTRRSLSLFAVLVLLPALAQAQARVWDFCARGIGMQPPLTPFTQTLRVQLTLTGAALDDELVKPFAAQLIRAKLWAGRAEQVNVEPYDEAGCAASLGNRSELQAELSADDVAEARRSLSRGDSEFPMMGEVASRTSASIDLASTPQAQDRQWLRIYWATNREPLGGTLTATAFGNGRSDDLRYGALDVAVLHQDTMRDLQSSALVKIERATSVSDFQVAATLQPMALDAWRAELRSRAARFEQPGVLLFIHGFNVSFVAAAQRSAQLAYDLAFPGPTVFFSWPSDASVVRYFADGRDARNSRRAAGQLLGELAALLPNGPLYVVAHSMGNRVLAEGLLQMLDDHPGARRALREVVMAAPDVDQEDFRLNYAPRLLALSTSGARFTLYASKNDLALSSSEFLQGGKRLGYGGDALYRQRGLDSVDASSVTKEFFSLNHSYFGDTTTVLSDLFYLIRARLAPGSRPNLLPLQPAPPATLGAWRF